MIEKNKKETKVKKTKIVEKESVKAPKLRYFESIGRRKEAVARVRIINDKDNKSGFLINEKTIDEYFPIKSQQSNITLPFNKLNIDNNKYFVSIKVRGGGLNSQSEAIRLGISRCLLKMDEANKIFLRKLGFLTRDSRKVERKKYGLKKARRAPQWKKR